ncbi:MAG: GWxTD domain-containing protein [Crocinitomicaceae bacterium]|nr:GWxTD domain-containing protein [Crocinitomicaceae bacterium]
MKLLLSVAFVLSAHWTFALRAFFDYRVFHIPGEGPYAEFVISFDGATLGALPADSGLYRSSAEITLLLSQSGKIVDFRKVNVSGPLIRKNEPADFLSLERFPLANGNYELEIQLKDLSNPAEKPDILHQQVVINNLSEGTFFSDIEFVSAYAPTGEQNAFSKAGVDIMPYISSFFPSSLNALIYYAEIYNTEKYFGQGAPFASVISVTDAMNRELEQYKRIKREKSAPVVATFQAIDISTLPTGEYKLRLEVRDKNNQVVATQERRFTRDNSIASSPVVDSTGMAVQNIVRSSFASRYSNRDSLYQIIQSLLPIAKNVERNTIDYQLSNADLQMLQSFFYTFWYNRAPADPEAAWRNYEKELVAVQSNFGTKIKRGWQTDRGRVYLQYGPPNTRVIRNHDPDYWPFEIWHYYETNSHQHNKRFLFYNTSLSNDMELLHSDAPNEVQNFDWKNLVRSRRMNDPVSTGRLSGNQKQDPYSGDELESLWYNPH